MKSNYDKKAMHASETTANLYRSCDKVSHLNLTNNAKIRKHSCQSVSCFITRTQITRPNYI